MSLRFKFGRKGDLFDEARRIIKSNLLNEAKSIEQRKKCAGRLYDITEEIAEADISDPEKRIYYTILLTAGKADDDEGTKKFYEGLTSNFYTKCRLALQDYKPVLEPDKSATLTSSSKPTAP